MRCTRFGQRCDGYIAKAPSKQSLQITTTRTLAPRAVTTSPNPTTSPIPTSSPNAASSLSPPLAHQSVFQDHEEWDAFHRFRERSERELVGVEVGGWSDFLIQACSRESSIRYAVLKVGSIGVDPTKSQASGRNGEQDFRATLTGCLLSFCFDDFRPTGAPSSKERVLLGLRQLRDWTLNAYGSSDQKIASATFGRPEPTRVETTISLAFHTLEREYESHHLEKEQEAYQRMSISAAHQMPQTFETVSSAHASLELIIRRSMHWLRIQKSQSQSQTNPSSPQTLPSSSPIKQQQQSSSFLSESKESLLHSYTRWDTSYGPLLKFARSKGSSEENFLAASQLRLNWLAGYLSIVNCSSYAELSSVRDDEDVEKGKGRQFRIEIDELTSIATLLLKKKGHLQPQEDSTMGGVEDGEAEGFSVELQIVIPLLVVGWMCRLKALRKFTVEELSRGERREGMCDAVALGKVMEWLDIVDYEDEGGRTENEGLVTKTLEGVRGIDVAFDGGRGVVAVKCLNRARGGWVERRVEIPW